MIASADFTTLGARTRFTFWFVAGCAFITALSFFLIPSHIPRQDPPDAVREAVPQNS